jgi:hypothetical protein
MVALADVAGAAHTIAASALSGHAERLRAGTGGACAPHVMGRDDFRQTQAASFRQNPDVILRGLLAYFGVFLHVGANFLDGIAYFRLRPGFHAISSILCGVYVEPRRLRRGRDGFGAWDFLGVPVQVQKVIQDRQYCNGRIAGCGFAYEIRSAPVIGMEARLIDRMIVNMERYWRLLGVQEDAEIIKDRLD